MLFLASLALAAPCWAAAQEPSPAAAQPAKQVVDAWERYQQASREHAGASGEEIAPYRERMEAARLAFRDAFERSTRASWDDMEAGMLAEGLHLMAQHALEHDPEMAGKAWEELLQRCPGDERAARVRTALLPKAYLALGHPATARLEIETLLATAPEAEAPGLRRFLGDAHAMEGELDRARVAYREARAAIPPDRVEENPYQEAARALELRLKLVGRPMPGLHVQEWIGEPWPRGAAGGANRAQAPGRGAGHELRGDGVLLLAFCATWSRPCRELMPQCDALARQYGGRGLRVVGAMHPEEKGFLPDGPGALDEGRLREDLGAEEFPGHLRAYRERSGVGHPFVVVPEEDVRERYGVTEIPALVLVGRDGRVRFVQVGAGSVGATEAAVRLALAD